ncbi:uncharacterized protein LOC107269163 isoform X3 [Cephus cinctus]|uniref:Uncharacterized protein LOC107269163 isoform X3 n=1 Tax=Cephus cinctus TaxID=211228 RepID=A0AAJ7W2P1_CEPCN|nr:uncharacterized protein LOC107269163 isoform X3 [Cephus cinctus]
MPRTKYQKKLKNLPVEIDECQSLIRDFQKQGKARIQKFEDDSKMEIKALDSYIKMIISSMPVEFLELTLNDILNMETCDKENSDSTNMNNEVLPAATVSITTHKLRKTGSDDGYDTEPGTSKTRIISCISCLV